jgi:hypothetical protein
MLAATPGPGSQADLDMDYLLVHFMKKKLDYLAIQNERYNANFRN